jgi:CheY-like chemotaxis protein
VSLKLLVVDDEAFNLEILAYYLGRRGFDVVSAEDGALALQRLEDNPEIDGIVLDRMMPNMDGMEFLARIKADERFKDVPVIMQTAAAARGQVLEGIKAGVYHYLTKPYEPEVLLAIVNSALDNAKVRKALKEEIRRHRRNLGLMTQSCFEFRTLEQARSLAFYIAACFPEPEQVVFGLSELLINAVEHGNCGITYAEKTALMLSGGWEEEVKRRLESPEFRDKIASLTFNATEDAIVVRIKDEGKGFDWRQYLELSPERLSDPHGRGIAISGKVAFHSLEYLGCGNEVVCTVELGAKPASRETCVALI